MSRQLRVGGLLEVARLAEIHVLDDLPPIFRATSPGDLLDPEPIASVGDAIVALVDDTLPHPPKGTWWCVGAPGGTTTIGMRPEATSG